MTEFTSEKPASLRVLKLLLALWWWALIAGGVVGLIVVCTGTPNNLQIGITGYASDIDTSAMSAADRDGRELAVSFAGPAKVKLLLPRAGQSQLSAGYRLMGIIIVLPFFLFSLYFVKQLRDVVRTIDQGNPFVEVNAGRVRMIGVLLIAYGVVESFARLLVSGVADSMVVPQGFSLNGRLGFDMGLLVAGIAVIVLSEVFRHGPRLREEHALTV